MHTSSLALLIGQATERRDAATSALGELHGGRDRAQAQLDALLDYQKEYIARLDRALAAGVSRHRLENDQRFIAALDQAIAQQQRVLAQSQSHVAEGLRQWQARQTELKSLDVLVERNTHRTARIERRREQQQNDEAAGRIARRHPV